MGGVGGAFFHRPFLHRFGDDVGHLRGKRGFAGHDFLSMAEYTGFGRRCFITLSPNTHWNQMFA